VSIGEELTQEERRRRRRAGDPRLTEADREILRRLVDGDLVDEFQATLDAVSASDPLLGGEGSED
jgi:DNA-binding CsgD family transcriptional regulator